MKTIHFFLVMASFMFLASLPSCSKDPCEDSMCMNGGVCIDGTCDCPTGFTGPSCNERAVPDKIRMSSVVIDRFPGMKDGQEWDGTDGPDIFFRLYDGTQPLAQPMLLWENALQQPYNFFINVIEMRNISGVHTMQLLDYDGIDITADFMGAVDFVPFDPAKDFPETIVLDNGGPVAFTITVDYLYHEPYR